MLKIPKEGAEEILKKLKNKQVEADNTIRYGAKKVTLREIKDIILARTGDIINFIGSAIDESGFNGLLARGIVLTGGAVDIDGVAEQVSNKSGYLVRKMLPIPLKGIKNSFYSDATVVGIFLEDMEREYKRSTERSKEENIQVTRRDAVRNNSVREEVDVFLESIEEERVKEKKEKFDFFRWLKELF